MVEKTVFNDYQIWKWTSCIVKGSPCPSFQAYAFENLKKNNKLQILQKVYKNVASSHKVTQSAAANGQLILTLDI